MYRSEPVWQGYLKAERRGGKMSRTGKTGSFKNEKGKYEGEWRRVAKVQAQEEHSI